MNKRTLIKKIVTKLVGELEVYVRAAHASRAEATHEQNKAENKYDTRGLEASYLARGQSKQIAELETSIDTYQKIPVRKFAPGEPIDVGAIVEVSIGGNENVYFIGPRAGGTEVVHERKEVLVLTPQSPLGSQLIGKKEGTVVPLVVGGSKNDYRILKVE